MKALIFGITGQDGSYLAELLLSKGYEVHGMIRRHSVTETQESRIEHLRGSVTTHYGDLTDNTSLFRLVNTIKPDEVYNLAAQSHVKIGADSPIFTANVNAIGALNVFEACRLHHPSARIYQASSSEMFGNCIDQDGFQRETTPMKPVSVYGCSKLFAYNLARHYRQAYGMFICNGILFNHESPRRGKNFVTRKVVDGAVDIVHGRSNDLVLGNLCASRDWGHSKDYVRAMYMMMQYSTPDDFVVSTMQSHSVEDLCRYVFQALGMDYRDYVLQDDKFLRVEELQRLKGDSTKARATLGWEPEYTFETLLDDMISSSVVNIEKGLR